MMDNVGDYLVSAIRSQQIVSAIRSQQIYAVNGDEEFSPQAEGTMELLESILASK
ncbi:exocyst complex component, partial [Trifolium medium]|nr:exocyst complex component [Trifolium medium]